MNKQYAVREFMQAAAQPIADTPHIPGDAERMLRCKLIVEELDELIAASGLYTMPLSLSSYSLERNGVNPSLVGVADALADLLYVVYGAAVTWGINIDQVFGEVHRSNMTKFIDGHTRADGKWQKGPSYEPARIAEIIASQQSSVTQD